MSVTEHDADRYRREGYLVVRGLFDPSEAALLRSAGHEIINRLSLRHDVTGTWKTDDVELEPTELFHCHDMQLHSSLFTKNAAPPTIAPGERVGERSTRP